MSRDRRRSGVGVAPTPHRRRTGGPPISEWAPEQFRSAFRSAMLEIARMTQNAGTQGQPHLRSRQHTPLSGVHTPNTRGRSPMTRGASQLSPHPGQLRTHPPPGATHPPPGATHSPTRGNSPPHPGQLTPGRDSPPGELTSPPGETHPAQAVPTRGTHGESPVTPEGGRARGNCATHTSCTPPLGSRSTNPPGAIWA